MTSGPRHVRVWAPRAREVMLVTGDADASEARAMVTLPGGWWVSPERLEVGTDYAFRLDGGPPRPDPRSAWQPAGVHGPSRLDDPGAFAWTDERWPGVDVRGAVIYELHVGTFTPAGTLDAAIARLSHLAELGVDVVQLMPLAAFNGPHGWGYDGVALGAVHEPYGGPAALRRFVDAAHASGLGVALDVVYNHLGPSGNYLAEFGPYFTDAHTTPWGDAVNLDGPDAAPVRQLIIENALGWFTEFHLDALRLDAVHALVDTSPRHVLAELSDAVAELAVRLGRPLGLIAESDLNEAVMVVPTAHGGLGMTAQWADDVHHALHAFLAGERQGYYVDFGSAATLAHALTRVFVHDGGYSTFRGTEWGAPVPADVSGHAFVAFSANHDQIGNRAQGDRPSATWPTARLAQAAAIVLGSPFTPMLFMGEEWGARTPFQFFTSHPEPELAAAVTEGRIAEFASHGWQDGDGRGDPPAPPDPQDPSTLTASVLDWEEPEAEGHPGQHARLLAWHRALIALRRRLPALASGDRTLTEVTHGATGPEPGAGARPGSARDTEAEPAGSDATASAAADQGRVDQGRVDQGRVDQDTFVVLHRRAPAAAEEGVAIALTHGSGPAVLPLPGAGAVLAAWDRSATRIEHPGTSLARLHLPGESVALVSIAPGSEAPGE